MAQFEEIKHAAETTRKEAGLVGLAAGVIAAGAWLLAFPYALATVVCRFGSFYDEPLIASGPLSDPTTLVRRCMDTGEMVAPNAELALLTAAGVLLLVGGVVGGAWQEQVARRKRRKASTTEQPPTT